MNTTTTSNQFKLSKFGTVTKKMAVAEKKEGKTKQARQKKIFITKD